MRSSLAALFLLIFAPFSFADSIPATLADVKKYNLVYGSVAALNRVCGGSFGGLISESVAKSSEDCFKSMSVAMCNGSTDYRDSWGDGSTFVRASSGVRYGGTVQLKRCSDGSFTGYYEEAQFAVASTVQEYTCPDSTYSELDSSVTPPVCNKVVNPNEQLCKDLAAGNPEPITMYHSCTDGTLRDALGCEMKKSGVGVCTGSGSDCKCGSQVIPTGEYLPPGTPGTNDAYTDGSLVEPESNKTDCIITPSNPSCTAYEEVKDPPRTQCVYVDGVPTSCSSDPGATRNTTTQTTVETSTDANGNVTTTTRTTTTTTTCTESGCSSTERVDVTTDVRDPSGNKIGGSTTSTGDGAGGATDWRGGDSYTDDGRLRSDNSDLIDGQGMPDPFAAGEGLDVTGGNMMDSVGSQLEAWMGESFVDDPSNLSPSDGQGVIDMFNGFDRECIIPDVNGISLNLCQSADKARPFLALIFAVLTVIYIWRRVSSTFAEMGS